MENKLLLADMSFVIISKSNGIRKIACNSLTIIANLEQLVVGIVAINSMIVTITCFAIDLRYIPGMVIQE